MCTDINNVTAPSLAHCCPYAVSILHSLYGTYYWKVNRHKRIGKPSQCFGVSFGRCSKEDIGRWATKNRLDSQNYMGNNSLGLYVSRHSAFRMGSATLIEREGGDREREGKAVTNKSMIYEIHPSVRPSELIMYAQQRECEKTDESSPWQRKRNGGAKLRR